MENSWFQDYVENPNKVEVFIKYVIKLPVIVDNFNVDDEPMHTRQDGQNITITFKKSIPKKLFEDIRDFSDCYKLKKDITNVLLRRNPSQYIVAHIKETLPWVNGEITKRKYNEGHIILKTVSLFDIEVVFLQDFQKNYHHVLWPLPIPKFPLRPDQNENSQKNKDVVFVRDLISAMTEFFYFDLDECIRKIITSLENYLDYYSIEEVKDTVYPTKEIKNSQFLRPVYCCLNKEYYDHSQEDIEVLLENIVLIYSVRNKIVHKNSRLKPDNIMFCRKAIVTLTKIYQSSFIKNDNKFDYIFSIYDQFEAVLTIMTGINLDQLDKATKATYDPSKIKSAIQGLKITEEIIYYQQST